MYHYFLILTYNFYFIYYLLFYYFIYYTALAIYNSIDRLSIKLDRSSRSRFSKTTAFSAALLLDDRTKQGI